MSLSFSSSPWEGDGRIGRALGRREAPPLLFLVLLGLGAAVSTAGFLTWSNIEGVLEQVSVIAIVALALNQVILAGEIDISVGSSLAVCALGFGLVCDATGSLAAGLATALSIGAAVGAANGLLSTYAKVPSIIATLGSLFVLRGGILLAAGSRVVDLDPPFRVLGIGRLGPAPCCLLVVLTVLVLFEVLARHSAWGRNLVAVGGNPRAARDIGLPVRATRLLCFVATGLVCGLAAAVFFGQIGQLQATAATGFELRVITAIVIGGTSIRGGAGSNAAPLIGALLVGTILDVMTLNRVPATYELLVLGALLLLAVLIEGLRSRWIEAT